MNNRARIIIPIIVLVVISIISGIVVSFVYQSMEEVSGRTYLLNVPENSNEKLPLVVALHGSGGNGFEFQQASGLDSEAFITAYPNGSGFPTDWAGGECCGNSLDTDDVGFIRDLIVEVEANYNVDTSRVFIVGFSSGGIMAYRLGCELSEYVTGIGVHSGTIELSECAPDYPVSLIHIHGDEDLVVPLEGGKGLFDTVLFTPAETGVKTFIVADECSSESLVVSGKVKKQLWSNCSRNTAVSFVTVREQGHGWFDSDSFSSTKTMIDFLSAHPRQ